MLARANRLVRAEEYRNTVRRGRRSGTRNTVVYVIHRDDATGARFGFIVSKAVGNAVTRNLIRRRLKAISHSLITTVSPHSDIVIRALPGARVIEWSELLVEVTGAIATQAAVKEGRG